MAKINIAFTLDVPDGPKLTIRQWQKIFDDVKEAVLNILLWEKKDDPTLPAL